MMHADFEINRQTGEENNEIMQFEKDGMKKYLHWKRTEEDKSKLNEKVLYWYA